MASSSSTVKSQSRFDPQVLLKLFSSCRGSDDVIYIANYITAYQELCKLFQLCGSLFSFIVSDLLDKLTILREHSTGRYAQEYETVQSMLLFEVSPEHKTHEILQSGTQTLLHLHRVMEFVSVLLSKLRDAPDLESFSSHCMEAYNSTLARHHSWLIQRAVHLAIYGLPSRQEMLLKMGMGDHAGRSEVVHQLVTEFNGVYGTIENLFVVTFQKSSRQ